MRISLTFRILAGLGLVTGSGLAGCSRKETIKPAQEPCTTTAVVRLCPGFTAICPTQHTRLELADGTRLRPVGPVWDSYQPRQLEGQVLRISYDIGPHVPNDSPSGENATLSCLEEAPPQLCGTR